MAGGFHTINFSDLYYTPIVTSTISKEGCPAIVNPRISLPADLTNVAPSWASCEPLFYGAWDPPSILKKASQLAPVQIGGGPVTTADGLAAATAVRHISESFFPTRKLFRASRHLSGLELRVVTQELLPRHSLLLNFPG